MLERLDVAGVSVLLFPANPLADGAGGPGCADADRRVTISVSLLGQTSRRPGHWRAESARPTERAGGTTLAVTVALRLAEHDDAWFWHVSVTNLGSTPAERRPGADVQDVALAPLGAVRTNEYYVSQYLDLTPVRRSPGTGRRSPSGRTCPARQPRGSWSAASAVARRWATDAIQLDRARPDRGRAVARPGAPTCPGTRLQHEHTVVGAADRADRAGTGEST